MINLKKAVERKLSELNADCLVWGEPVINITGVKMTEDKNIILTVLVKPASAPEDINITARFV